MKIRNIILGAAFLLFGMISYSQVNSSAHSQYSGLWLGTMNISEAMSLQLAFEPGGLTGNQLGLSAGFHKS